jgi:hypothetical protein
MPATEVRVGPEAVAFASIADQSPMSSSTLAEKSLVDHWQTSGPA